MRPRKRARHGDASLSSTVPPVDQPAGRRPSTALNSTTSENRPSGESANNLSFKAATNESVRAPQGLRRGGGHRQRAPHDVVHSEPAALHDAVPFDSGEGRIEQHRRRVRSQPGSERRPSVQAPADERTRRPLGGRPARRSRAPSRARRRTARTAPSRLDQAVERPQGRGPVHPVKRAAHRNQPEPAQAGRQVERTSLDEVDLRARRLGLTPRSSQHGRIGVHADHLPRPARECDRQEPGATAEIEHAVLLTEPDPVGDFPDQRVRIAQSMRDVERDRGPEPVRHERWEYRHVSLLHDGTTMGHGGRASRSCRTHLAQLSNRRGNGLFRHRCNLPRHDCILSAKRRNRCGWASRADDVSGAHVRNTRDLA